MRNDVRLRRLERDVRGANAAITRVRSEEDYTHREAQINDRRTLAPPTFGSAANRPPADYLFQKGVACALYFATDTNTLYAWNGTAWKSTVLT